MRLAPGLDDRGAAIDPELSITKITSRGQRLLLGLLDRRRRDEGQQIIGVADMLAKQPDRRRGFRGGLPGQFENRGPPAPRPRPA